MGNEVSFRDEADTEASGSKLKTIGLCIAGWIVGYLISLTSSVLFFLVGRIPPDKPASAMVMFVTAIYGIVFAVIAAVVGASFSRRHALGIGAAIAATIAVAGFWADSITPNAEHWSEVIAIFLMAPAAQLGSLFRRLPY